MVYYYQDKGKPNPKINSPRGKGETVMEKRFDLSMMVSNGKGCGYIEHKTFIGEDVKLEDVKNFVRKHAVENKDLDIKYT